jgi:hypothetical protein
MESFGYPHPFTAKQYEPTSVFATATIAAIAAVTTTAITTTIATTAVTTTATAGTSSANALEVPGTTLGNALTIPDSDSDDTGDMIPPLMFRKKEDGLTIILGMNINNHLKSIKSDISIVVVKTEPGTSNTNYVNGINYPATVLTITEAPVAVMNLLPHMKNIGNRKDLRTVDIIGFLKTNGVKLTPLANNYEKIMTTDHTSPIIIDYSVMRHSFESTDLPPSWIQFCILFKKEKLLVPFNLKGDAINLGNQYNEQKWTKDFTHYCHHNLNYRIVLVDRAGKKGSQGPKNIVRGLHFNIAWAITMPTPDPKP